MFRAGGNGWHIVDEIDLAGLLSDHADLGRLCNALEAVADDLPTLPDEDQKASLAERLGNLLPSHEARETASLVALFGASPDLPLDRALLRYMRACRASYTVQAQDLVAALSDERPRLSADTLGYMLRSFFQSCRMAMAFEELAIHTMARSRLTRDAAGLLASGLITLGGEAARAG